VTTRKPRLMFLGVVFILASRTGSQESISPGNMSPVDLVRSVIRNELSPSRLGGDVHWRYRLFKEVNGKEETREVVETKSGSLDLLIAIAGKPLSDAQWRTETERVLRLSRGPEEQRRLEQIRRKDTEQSDAFLQMIPKALLFEYAGASGDLLKLEFKPNLAFSAPGREAKLLHEMAGEIWLDRKQQRLVSINGRLMNEVKFLAGLGLLGQFEKGGQFSVKRAEIIHGDWELVELTVNIRGKALVFKTISLQQKEVHLDFKPVSHDLSLPDAADLLLSSR